MSQLLGKISTRLYVSFGGAVMLVVLISLLTLYILDYIGDMQHSLSEKNVPQMMSAFAVAQETSALASAAPKLVTAETPKEFAAMAAMIGKQEEQLDRHLAELFENQEETASMQEIRAGRNRLSRNIAEIKQRVQERFGLRKRNLALKNKLHHEQAELMARLSEEVDNQLFYTLTGYRTMAAAPAARRRHFSAAEFRSYRHLTELREAAAIAAQLLSTASTVNDAALLEPLQERFDATADNIARALEELEGYPAHDALEAAFAALLEIGHGDGNSFALHHRERAVAEELSALLHAGRMLGTEIVARVESIVAQHGASTEFMVDRAAQVTAGSTFFLLALNAISIVGAVLLGWLFVQRRLIRRLERLSGQMQRMAGGELEAAVDIDGHDEIAHLSEALEVFRKNTLEMQRLNMVEVLAEELKEKNQELESANEKLGQAQDQIVMQEKLAALGELTAGVAHEIKNPMNFIMNFSEVSKDLLEEMLEEVAKIKPAADAEASKAADADPDAAYDPGLVEEIAQDLTENLKRIREHGERANRIVIDMLKMGRGAGEWHTADINVLLNQHALLAFHSARAANSEFQLDIQEDYADDIGEIVVQPQDLGRVFLNLVTNACYATNDKRTRLAAEGGEAAQAYRPTLQLSTRLAGEMVEVRVRDNGCGIPESALEHIFNPFFTTKPTDQGTGLGLSLSSDIIREHGGELRVDTQVGEYTEMIVALPREQSREVTESAATGEAEADDEAEAGEAEA